MEDLFQFLKKFEKFTKNTDLLMAIGLIGVLAVMIIPLPPTLLDMSLTLSLALSILVLLVALYINKSLDFSVFPSLLLITTLLRLSLNVASTRLILAHGHEGPQAAGQVISAFGNFVIGNNYVIGFIVFVILVVINFIVITKGSGRIAEVAARFTLDAMPGKQMSIDADLNAGLITEEDARRRRKEIEEEADFYGAMDGASKFVRGDAIAGIIITLINIIGGLLIGTIQKGLDLSTAAKYYTMLTIGDGLVTQIPALIISTAAGMVVTRNANATNVSSEVARQLLINPKAVGVTGGVLFVLGLVPGLPTMSFFTMAIFLSGLSWIIKRYQKDEVEQKKREAEEASLKPTQEKVESLLPLDVIELEVGYALINAVESDQSGDLVERIVSIRKQFATDLGIVVPSVHIRDNLQLDPGDYRILIKGNKVASGKLKSDCYMAMDPGNVTQKISGIPTTEPAFGLDALWVSKNQKEQAEMAGYTVVDIPTVMATHLTEVVRSHASELLGRQEAQSLIDNFKKNYPKVVEELVPEVLNLGGVVKVLQNLLKEGVSIRDLLTIFETLADEAPKTKDLDLLTESVRRNLNRSITAKFVNDRGNVSVISMSPRIENLITNSLIQTEQGVQLVMDPVIAQRLISEISKTIESNPEVAAVPVVLTTPTNRRHLYKLTSRFIPQLAVISHSEVSSDARVKSVGIVELENAS